MVTNEQILRYKTIESQLFTEKLFVTKEANSTRGLLCLQVFVSEKGYVKVYLMK